ncbi:hypothetical protein H2O64_09950 [Kordia sp. YSTF-M3]|uniref:Lipoprotein n=1 Tax=Kordia aestuariivivens TaxID=2759037 RepID=A0ABR7Q8V4_9FLAO|nr:hypothetical protein [Kordia aestuariivivens]MBC8754994.1 hypothetical protein [Kordia aestuariivivens]
MRNNFSPKTYLHNFKFLFLATTLLIFGCSDDDSEPTTPATITVGVFLINGTTYTDTNKDLIFTTGEACQSWSRTAQADVHSTGSHDHFNAARNVTYDPASGTITWIEYGPETTQAAIDVTCEAGVDGAPKIANKTDYSADKNFFLQIKLVE